METALFLAELGQEVAVFLAVEWEFQIALAALEVHRSVRSDPRGEGTATGTTWALADEKMKKIRNSAKDQNTVTASI